MNLRSAELGFGDVCTDRALHDWRSRRKKRARLARHHREVAEHGHRGHSAGGGAHDPSHDGRMLSGVDDGSEQVERAWDVGMSLFAGGRHVGAGAIKELYERNLVVARQFGVEDRLPALRRHVGRPTRDGEVLAADRDGAAVDLAEAPDVGRRNHIDELAILVDPAPGQAADLLKAPLVQHAVDAFADRQLALIVLALDALLTAHAAGEFATPLQLVDFGLPVSRLVCFRHSAIHLPDARSLA